VTGVRVYLPATSTTLRELHDTRMIAPPLTAFAVTPGWRDWYQDGDEEELEYAALTEAARASLRLLDADPDAVRRRVVIAFDADPRTFVIRDDLDRGVVRLEHAVDLGRVASIHVDDAEAEAAVAAAAAVIVAADLGDDAAVVLAPGVWHGAAERDHLHELGDLLLAMG